MNNLSDLKQLLQFYDQNLKGSGDRAAFTPIAGGGYLSDGNGENRPGLLWAQEFMREQMRPQHPDFFGGQPTQQAPAYIPPQQVDMNAQRPQPQMRNDYFANDPLRNRTQNFLAQLLGRPPRMGSY